jgi:hypothetical protein
MRHGHSRRSRRMMPPEIAGRLLASLRPTRHLLTRSLADMPIRCPEYRQVDRVVQEIDGLAGILTGDATYYHRDGHSADAPDETWRTGSASEPDKRS